LKLNTKAGIAVVYFPYASERSILKQEKSKDRDGVISPFDQEV